MLLSVVARRAMHPTRQPQTLVAHGTIASERLLLERMAQARNALTAGGDFQHPIWLVVPTRVLRRHLQHQLVQGLGSTIGVKVWTLGGLVSSMAAAQGHGDSDQLPTPDLGVDRPTAADDAATNDDLLLEILAIRHLAEMREVPPERGRAPGAVVRDLIDAGLEIDHLAPIIDGLADTRATAGEVERAEQLLRAAGVTLTALGESGVRPARLRFEHARQLLIDGKSSQPGEVFVYGFADLTGVGADFLQTLVATFAGTVILNQPPDPNPATPIPAIDRYLDRWRSRLVPPRTQPDWTGDEVTTRVTLLQTAKPNEELSEIGLRIRALLDAGVAPTRIGIVLRQPAVYGHIALRELRRFGIPCSAPNIPGQLDADGRRFRAAFDLIEQSDAAPLSRWLDARRDQTEYGREGEDVPTFEIRRRLARAGLRTLGQLAGLEPELVAEDGQDSGVSRRRVDEAQALLQHIRGWGLGSGDHHADRLSVLLKLLGWSHRDPDSIALLEGAQGICIELSPEEFLYWLRRSIEQVGRTNSDPWDLGGVRLLRIQDSREVTFDHLFVPGMSRGLFPRAIRPDSELGEDLREVLAGNHGLLPDLPIASRFHDEEKYLFAQLLSSAEHVTLSWPERRLDERKMPRSPLLSLLDPSLTGGLEPVDRVHPTADQRWRYLPPGQRRIETALQHRELAGDPTPEVLAAILAEHERTGPGPYLGWIGTSDDPSNPRHKELWVTNLENYARCPWQSFLQKFLGLKGRRDPDLAAPDLPPLAVGGITHSLLESIAERAGVPRNSEWHEVIDRSPVRLTWPGDDELQQMVNVSAAEHTRKDGIYLPGYAETLAEAVLAVLKRAKAADAAGAEVVAVETKGAAGVSGHRTRFRADRIEIRDGVLLATDFKSGKPKGRNVLGMVGKAEMLQLPTYVLGGAEAARMLYLGNPDHPAGEEVLLTADDEAPLAAFGELAAGLAAGWQSGRFFPRVLDHGGNRPRTCDWCEFTETCSERDPFARDRLQQALDQGDDPVASQVWDVTRKDRK